ncbi:protein regulator of cytokinesis 1-like isoform X2 [Sarcophilus harrisii]|uniref:protein regulator of cytokinesis 1-like isoform X2 n=1 Tax=Sarcophilus harrisii TaxID=9305 RepID=UPI001301E83E|nr:protein regulator of cytokinesis 1-like isoform X2 [Sarcophilus harrisii]
MSEVLNVESMAYLHKALSFLQDLFESMGIPEDQRLERMEVVKSLLDTIIAEEENKKMRLLENIALYRKQLDTLCFELNVEHFQEEEGITMLQLKKDLSIQLEVRLKQKEDRLCELKRLQEQDQAFCELLHTSPYSMDRGSVPSLEELDQFRCYLATLAETKACRQEEFVSAKRQILLLMEELDYAPDTSLEKDVSRGDEDTSDLSLEKLAALHDLLHRLEVLRAENEIVCEELHAQIQKLWNELQVPCEERETLAILMTDSLTKRRKVLQSEVDRLEELKIENLKKVIEAVREELSLYWEKCFYSQDQREAFAPYYSEDYSETLLQLHDAEVVQLKHYYEVHRELFEGIQKWEENWKLFLEFELEEELKTQIELWEQKYSKDFVVNGQKFLEYVMEQWEMHRLEKEKAKQERHLKKSQQIEIEMFYGSAPRIPSKREGLGSRITGKVLKSSWNIGSPEQKMLNTSQREHNRTIDLDESVLSNGYSQLSLLQTDFQIHSIDSTYSEFMQQEFSEASKSDHSSGTFTCPNIES